VTDHYATLGVRPEATLQEIEAAYRRIALERGWEDGFWRELRNAYDVLSDPEERARYDVERDGAALRVPKRPSRNPIDRLFPKGSGYAGVCRISFFCESCRWARNPSRLPFGSLRSTCD